jgi:hypothetical protein
MIRYRCLRRTIAGTRSRLDPGTADRLLCGESVGAEHRVLATVLSAAATGGQPAELHGRPAAMAAFRAAATMPVTPQERPSTVRSALVKLLTVKTALLTALVLGTGGVALAAGTGMFSRPPTSHVGSQPAAPTVATSTPDAPAPAPPNPSTSPTPATHPPSARRTPQVPPATGSTSPSLVTLCRAYLAMVDPSTRTGDDGDIDFSAGRDSPALQTLIAAAGSRAAVGPFCIVTLIRASHHEPDGPPIIGPHDGRGRQPGQPGEPTVWPPNRSTH